MRRKDREMDPAFALEVIDKAAYGVVSIITDKNLPYGVPLSIARKGNNLYFHSAPQGEKVMHLAQNPDVCVTFVGKTRVPDDFSPEEMRKIDAGEAVANHVLNKVFTTEYESAVVKGQVVLVEDEKEKIDALRIICEKYTPAYMDYFAMAVKASLKKTHVYKIEMAEITGKSKRV